MKRLMTMQEILVKYPKAYFTRDGHLVYDKENHKRISPKSFYVLGTKAPGYWDELYITINNKEKL